ncbi:MAG: hypothetical protein MK179_05045 [Pirellulaceae bacterium]|nr:hypothetical protein [Pirellulaceae bacterium]
MNTDELRRPEPPKPHRTILSIFLAFVLFAIVSAVLFFLTLGSFGQVFVIGGVILMVIGFHYVVWGWWLGRIIREEEGQSNESTDQNSTHS